MNKRIRTALFVIILAVTASASAQPVISEKQDIAIFALGYYGWNIPGQALGSIDGQIQKVFSDLGRFTILGVSQRLSSGGLEQFISAMRQSKQASFVMPEKIQFGEAFLTEAEFNRLVGAFIVVVPVVLEFNSFYDTKNLQYQTNIKTNITFIDVANNGAVLAIKTLSSSGSHKTNQYESVRSAIDSIPGQLQYEIRSIPEFQINTRILSASGSTIRLQLGADMGLRKGDEYSIIQRATVEGFDDSREAGLVVIKDVGQEVSTGQVLFSSIKLGKDTQLREIPRMGSELDLYIHSIGSSTVSSVVPGLRATASRGFYAFRPYVAVQVPLGLMSSFLWDLIEIFPVNVILGGEYVVNMGRLSVAPNAGIGLSYFVITAGGSSTDTDFLSHIGFQASVRAAYLINRNLRAFVDIGYEGWLAVTDVLGNVGYEGTTVGAGVTFKL